MKIKGVNNYCQIKEGDCLYIKKKNGYEFIAQCVDIFYPCDSNETIADEEIILNKKYNDYFNMSMYLTGESWVKEVIILEDVKITNILKTKLDFPR